MTVKKSFVEYLAEGIDFYDEENEPVVKIQQEAEALAEIFGEQLDDKFDVELEDTEYQVLIDVLSDFVETYAECAEGMRPEWDREATEWERERQEAMKGEY